MELGRLLSPEPKKVVLLEIIKKILRPSQDDLILDVGCGLGWIIGKLSESSTSVGLDVSKDALAESKKRCHKVEYLLGDAQMLPFKKACFNKVVCIEVLEHLPRDLQAIHEIKRATKIGGSIFILVPNVWARWGFFSREHGKVAAMFGHLREYDLSNLVDVLGKGIQVIGKGYYGHFASIVGSLYLRILFRIYCPSYSKQLEDSSASIGRYLATVNIPRLFALLATLLLDIMILAFRVDRKFMSNVCSGDAIYIVGRRLSDDYTRPLHIS